MDSKTVERRLNRIEKAKLNTTITLVTAIVMGVFSFIERTIFNRFFLADYLGLYSFFNNVIGILSAAELGISTSIAFALYAPLEHNEEDQIAAIMRFFGKAYKIVGTIILAVGLLIIPFMKYLLNTEVPMSHVRLYFIFFLLKTVSNYYFGYKETLLAANQEQYKINLVNNISWTILYFVDILIAVFTQNFILYSISIFVINLLRATILNIIATKEFPEIRKYKNSKINPINIKHIIRNTKGLIITKLSTILVSATDSVLISAMVGTAFLGKYSNYQMITAGLMTLSTLLPKAITAGVGNAGVTESKRTMARSFDALNLASFFIYSTLTIILINIVNPIVRAFFGADRALGIDQVVLIFISFYLSNQREILLTFKSSLGLYWEDRKRPLAEGLTNLIVSLILGYWWGFNGIILGTIASQVLVNLMIEPRVIFHSGLKSSAFWYYITITGRFCLSTIIAAFTYFINSYLPFTGIIEIIIKTLTTTIIVLAVFFIVYRKNPDAITIVKTVKLAFTDKRRQRKMIESC